MLQDVGRQRGWKISHKTTYCLRQASVGRSPPHTLTAAPEDGSQFHTIRPLRIGPADPTKPDRNVHMINGRNRRPCRPRARMAGRRRALLDTLLRLG